MTTKEASDARVRGLTEEFRKMKECISRELESQPVKIVEASRLLVESLIRAEDAENEHGGLKMHLKRLKGGQKRY